MKPLFAVAFAMVLRCLVSGIIRFHCPNANSQLFYLLTFVQNAHRVADMIFFNKNARFLERNYRNWCLFFLKAKKWMT